MSFAFHYQTLTFRFSPRFNFLSHSSLKIKASQKWQTDEVENYCFFFAYSVIRMMIKENLLVGVLFNTWCVRCFFSLIFFNLLNEFNWRWARKTEAKKTLSRILLWKTHVTVKLISRQITGKAREREREEDRTNKKILFVQQTNQMKWTNIIVNSIPVSFAPSLTSPSSLSHRWFFFSFDVFAVHFYLSTINKYFRTENDSTNDQLANLLWFFSPLPFVFNFEMQFSILVQWLAHIMI